MSPFPALRRGGDFSREAAKKNWRERINQLLSGQTNHDPISMLRNLCLHGFPVFNIWEQCLLSTQLVWMMSRLSLKRNYISISFRLIISAFRDCGTWFTVFAGPTTVARVGRRRLKINLFPLLLRRLALDREGMIVREKSWLWLGKSL